VSMHDLASMARVRAAVKVPISVDQGVWLDQHLIQAIRLGAGDVLTTNPHKLGGMFVMKKVAAAAGMAGMTVCKHSFPELGVALAAGLQVLATLPNMTEGNQNYLRLLSDDVIVGGLMKVENGTVRVPVKPGLGVELDPDKVEKYHDLYCQEGGFSTRSFK
jgi:L-alanine-DL-glutamate epimerase-like enolase superfamily enzyme